MEILAEGLEFPEGPVALPDGTVVLVEIKRQTLTRIRADGGRETIADLAGGPNGAALGPDGKLYVCNNGGLAWRTILGHTVSGHAAADYRGGSIQRIDLATRAVETLFTHVGKKRLKGPNDLVFDQTGGFWFTDHGKDYEEVRDHGGLYYVAPGASEIAEAVFPIHAPNGVGLSPDGKSVYVAETFSSRLWAFDLDAPGRLAPSPFPIPGRVVVNLPGLQLLDSLAVEADGSICLATLLNGGITRVAADGATMTHTALPDLFVTNICFGGADMCDAYVTLSGTGKLAKLRWPRAGLKLNFCPYP